MYLSFFVNFYLTIGNSGSLKWRKEMWAFQRDFISTLFENKSERYVINTDKKIKRGPFPKQKYLI